MEFSSTDLQALIRGEEVEGFKVINRIYLGEDVWRKKLKLIFEYQEEQYYYEYFAAKAFPVFCDKVD